MQTIWKYVFPLDTNQTVELPTGAKVIHVAGIRDEVTAWFLLDPIAFLLDPTAKLEQRKFSVYGTGHKISDRAVYVGTAICDPFVWHLFEIKGIGD